MKKLSVFLCHASQDKPVVRELYQRLNASGWVDPWLDEEKLLPGMDWDMEIEKAVEAANVVIVCLSNSSISKEGYVQRELRYVLDIALEKPEGTIFIIPLRLDDIQPPRRLRGWQYVDYFPSAKRNWAYERILASLQIRAQALGMETQRKAETPFAPPPVKLEREPVKKEGRPSQAQISPKITQKSNMIQPGHEGSTAKALSHLMYTKTHEWFDPQTGFIGLTDYAQLQLSDIVFVEILVEVGDRLERGKPIASLESVTTSAELYAPVAGEVIATNQPLYDTPESLNNDPYGKGWLLKVKNAHPVDLMDAATYKRYCETGKT
jgi:glycine cleavage system H protein